MIIIGFWLSDMKVKRTPQSFKSLLCSSLALGCVQAKSLILEQNISDGSCFSLVIKLRSVRSAKPLVEQSSIHPIINISSVAI